MFLRRCFPFLRYLSESRFSVLYNLISTPLFLYKGRYVYKEYQPAEYIYIIYQGECSLEKILHKSSKNEECIKLIIVEKGDIVGLEAIHYDAEIDYLYSKDISYEEKPPVYNHSLKSENDNTVILRIRLHKIEEMKEKFLEFLLNLKREKDKIYQDLLNKRIDMKNQLNVKKNILLNTITPLEDKNKTKKYKIKLQKGIDFGKVWMDNSYTTRYKPINSKSNRELPQSSKTNDKINTSQNKSNSLCKTLDYKSTNTISLSYEYTDVKYKLFNKKLASSQNRLSEYINMGREGTIVNKNKLKFSSSTLNSRIEETSDLHQSNNHLIHTENSDIKYVMDEEKFLNNYLEDEKNLTDRVKRENVSAKSRKGKLPNETKKKKYPVALISNNINLNLWKNSTSKIFFNSGKYNLPLISLDK
jgi:hypothetical protein